MKTICLDLTDQELAALRAEPQAYVTRPAVGPETAWFNGEPMKTDVLLGRLPERMAVRITVDPDCDCWLVGGHGTGKGHANVSVAGKSRKFHRVVYQLHVGPIPPGKILDHVKARGCRHRNCANFNHLEPVTVKENTDRGDGVKHQFGRRGFHEGYDEA